MIDTEIFERGTEREKKTETEKKILTEKGVWVCAVVSIVLVVLHCCGGGGFL